MNKIAEHGPTLQPESYGPGSPYPTSSRRETRAVSTLSFACPSLPAQLWDEDCANDPEPITTHCVSQNVTRYPTYVDKTMSQLFKMFENTITWGAY